ncbi:MAG: hemerythrin domain-containing protein [Candidatus Binatia bacterium]|nr:hemerythrin domain-containing protein [Candidatus Binatia bacterium]
MARRHPSLIPLSHDHREALGLVFRLHNPAPPGRVTAMTPVSTAASRATETIEFFSRHLETHFRAEEEALFPFLVARAELDDASGSLVERLIGEHRRLGELRDAIEAAARGAGELEEALVAFGDLLETHVRTEERELFARFPADLPEDEAGPVAAAIRAALGRD